MQHYVIGILHTIDRFEKSIIGSTKHSSALALMKMNSRPSARCDFFACEEKNNANTFQLTNIP